jgi:hypothetical protein
MLGKQVSVCRNPDAPAHCYQGILKKGVGGSYGTLLTGQPLDPPMRKNARPLRRSPSAFCVFITRRGKNGSYENPKIGDYPTEPDCCRLIL